MVAAWSADPFIYLKPEKVTPFGRSLPIKAIIGSTPSPLGGGVDVELLQWERKWCSLENADLPTSAVQTLTTCYQEFFPNIHTLIRILYTLPITSAECEHSFSTLRRLKTGYFAIALNPAEIYM